MDKRKEVNLLSDYFFQLEEHRIKAEAEKIAERMAAIKELPVGAPVRVGWGCDEHSNYYLATYFLGIADEHRVRVIYAYPSGGDMEIKVTKMLASDVVPMDPADGKPNLFDEHQDPRCPIDAELKEGQVHDPGKALVG